MSKLHISLGLVALGVIGAPVAYALSWYVVAVLLLALPGAIAAVAVLDLHRQEHKRARRAAQREKELDRRLTELTKAIERPRARADVPSQEDLVGTVGVIQAQYAGRLDRAQSSLDEAVRALRAELGTTSAGRSLLDMESPEP